MREPADPRFADRVRASFARLADRPEVKPEESMKPEYDFSQGERGKFYRPDAEFNIP